MHDNNPIVLICHLMYAVKAACALQATVAAIPHTAALLVRLEITRRTYHSFGLTFMKNVTQQCSRHV
jgi:hypothetical protein